MPYRVDFISARVRREVERLPPEARARINARLRLLAEDPRTRGIRQLSPNIYRTRVGRYRVIYEVDDAAQEVHVLAALRRSERTYRE